jgi:hypothetical protein
MKTLKITAVLGLLLLFFSQCEKDVLLQNTPIGQAKSLNADDLDKEEKMIQLIRKLENPYTVEAMNHAQDTLIELGVIDNPIEINTTHYYVRFLPSSWEELDNLENKFEEEQNELFDFPLDYELSEEGTYYQDPSLPDSAVTWQYTVVPVNYNFSNIRHEKLANLFLYDDTEEDTELEEFLEDISLMLTGNWDEDDEMPSFQKSLKASKWTPSGTIRAQDHQLGQLVPVEGTKVTMRRWFKWAIDYTDHNGYYQSPKKFKKKVDYKIKWVTPKYRIRAGWYGVAWTNGPKQNGPWNRDIINNLPHFYAWVHIAAHDFFYHDPFNLYKPNPIPKLKISALDKCGTAVNVHFASVVGGPDNRIYRKTSGECVVKNSLLFYGHTIHELRHSSHRASNFWNFVAKNTDFTRESWATTVEWSFIMNKYYSNTLYNNPTKRNFLNGWTTTSSFTNREVPGVSFSFAMNGTEDYTTFFIDLIDCDASNSSGSGVLLTDKVCGYELKQLESSLNATCCSNDTPHNIENIIKKLKDDYSNSTENQLDFYAHLIF